MTTKKKSSKKKQTKQTTRLQNKTMPPEELVVDGCYIPVRLENFKKASYRTYCRKCDCMIEVGEFAFLSRGESYCAVHFEGKKPLPGSRFYLARFQTSCAYCSRVFERNRPIFWRSLSVCMKCGNEHLSEKVTEPPSPQPLPRKDRFNRRLRSPVSSYSMPQGENGYYDPDYEDDTYSYEYDLY